MLYIVYVGDCPMKVRAFRAEADSLAEMYADQLKTQGRNDIPVTVKCIEEPRLRTLTRK